MQQLITLCTNHSDLFAQTILTSLHKPFSRTIVLQRPVLFKYLHLFFSSSCSATELCFDKGLPMWLKMSCCLKRGRFVCHISQVRPWTRDTMGWGQSLNEIIRASLLRQKTEGLFVMTFCFLGPLVIWALADLWPSVDRHKFLATNTLSGSYWQFSE